ncbi:MAG: TlpA disulfide reductase family protein [Caldilineaceae bacterium]
MVRLCPMLPAGLALAGALLLAACGARAATPSSAPAAVETTVTQEAGAEMMTDTASSAAADSAVEPAAPHDEMAGEMATESMTGEVTGETVGEKASARPAWQSLPLTEARTGTSFTLADFAGKTVFVEPFATWCTNCRQNLANVHAARQQAGADVVFVALSVEPNIGSEALAAYAADTGYDLMFAAMPPEMLQALAAQFGQTIANPPATPHFVIRPDGTTGDLVTGIKSTAEILAQVSAQG